MNKKLYVKLIGPDSVDEYETQCIYNEKTNEIKYIENDKLKTIVKFNINDYTLSRKNDNMRLRYRFDIGEETEGELVVNELNTTVNLRVKTLSIKNEGKKIEIEFLVENDKFNYILEVK